MQPPPHVDSPDTRQNSLILIGNSARAAAFDAKLAGFKLLAIDRFGDQDLIANCDQWVTYDDDGQRWFETALAWPESPIVPIGGFSWESLPEGAKASAMEWRSRLIAYPSKTTLAELNAPHRLVGVAKRSGIFFPETWQLQDGKLAAIAPISNRLQGQAKRWLVKPRKHAGGVGIQRCSDTNTLSNQEIRQAFVPGRPIGANFIATGEPSPTRSFLLGVFGGLTYRGNTQHPFLYGGSFGPLHLSRDITSQITTLGQVVAKTFSLRGLFNVDLILAKDQTLWLLEINPRYSASMELISRQAASRVSDSNPTTTSLIDLHLGCYQNRTSITSEIESYLETQTQVSASAIFCKRIVYSRQATVYPKNAIEFLDVDDRTCIADIPRSDAVIRDGEPICTVIRLDDDSSDNVLRRSAQVARRIRATGTREHGRGIT